MSCIKKDKENILLILKIGLPQVPRSFNLFSWQIVGSIITENQMSSDVCSTNMTSQCQDRACDLLRINEHIDRLIQPCTFTVNLILKL